MSITKKPFIAIAVVISAFALVLVYAKGLDFPPAFADENFKASVTESWPGEKLTAKDVSELRSLDFFKEENIGSFEDLKMFTSLEYLSLQGFSVYEVNSILENCPNTLEILIIEGDEGYPIADSFCRRRKIYAFRPRNLSGFTNWGRIQMLPAQV